MDKLVPLNDYRLPGGEATIPITVTPAAADHLAAWATNMRIRAAHEGSHAVVACLRHLRIKEVDLRGQFRAYTHISERDDDQAEAETATQQFGRIVTLLAGLAIEELLLGEVTSGCQADISAATNLAIERFSCGMDPQTPFVALDAFDRTPDSLREELAVSVLRTLERAREEARLIVTEYRDTILAFASKLYETRRLSDEALIAALRDVGLDPVPIS